MTESNYKNRCEGLWEAGTSPLVLTPKSSPVMDRHCLYILMACYNGARYLEEQIRSIQAQSISEWRLIIRDDGSQDETLDVVRLCAKDDSRICVLADEAGNLGPVANFSTLIGYALEHKADYVFFADQDDVWHPAKLELMLGGMREMEVAFGEARPLLVHCDLAVVDVQMREIAPSFTDYMHLSPKTAGLGVLLVQNQVTGCACLINRMALELANPVPANVLMHDWWLALLCAASGKIGYVPMTLVNYRQHGANVVGAKAYWRRLLGLLRLKQWEFHVAVIRRGIEQTGLVIDRLTSRKASTWPGVLDQLSAYSAILDTPPLARVRILRLAKIYKQSRGRGMVFKAIISAMRTHRHN